MRFGYRTSSKASVAQTHQFLAANDKANLTPDALSKRKTFLCETAIEIKIGG